MSKLLKIFPKKFVIGMVHLKPLPGSPQFDGSLRKIEEAAIMDAERLSEGGIDGLIIENFGDTPFLNGEISLEGLLMMTRIITTIRNRINLPFGVNVEFNDWKSEISLAYITEAKFIRVEVLVEARFNISGIVMPAVSKLLRMRKALGADDVLIFADFEVKHTYPLFKLPIEFTIKEISKYADAIVVTGAETGSETPLEIVKRVKELSDKPVIVGSGVNKSNILRTLEIADGVIIGTALKKDGVTHNEVDLDRVKEIMSLVKTFRGDLN
ncbi:MAG: BtpA/SgcQ family protein [Thermotogaceae bacterium]|nr:BtpA/SgcQ family protein [Thermotogaceae bacterium]RKX52481.1 MAG: photosystem I assembly BtpA [Thermotoga sp.]